MFERESCQQADNNCDKQGGDLVVVVVFILHIHLNKIVVVWSLPHDSTDVAHRKLW